VKSAECRSKVCSKNDLQELKMEYSTSTALAEFNWWSRSYDRSILQRMLFQPSHRLMLKHLAEHDQRVLDIGCGTGQFAAKVVLANPHAHVWGLDLSDKMLEQAQQRCQPLSERLHLVRGDSEHLPFSDNTFDLVTCSHSFHHYPRQHGVVAEMYRVLKPGGRVMLIDGDRDGWWGWFIYDGVVTPIEGNVHHCSAPRFRDLFTKAGFEVTHQLRRGRLAPYVLTIAHAVKKEIPRELPSMRAA
jgi:ubiquinone/menaquinone biosynthesis C-methylase UbiE